MRIDKNTRKQRKLRIRSKIRGTKQMPRLSVFRSNAAIYAQIIDDQTGKTIIGVAQKKAESKANKTNTAKEIGLNLAKLAKKKNISKVVFDKGGYKYHGRVKALAEGAREGGLQF